MTNVYFGLRMPPVTAPDVMASLLTTLCTFAEVQPHRYGDCEPVRTRFHRADVGRIAAQSVRGPDFLWETSRRAVAGVLSPREGLGEHTADVALFVDPDRLKGLDFLGELLRRLSAEFGAVFGYLHFLTDPDVCSGRLSKTARHAPPNDPYLNVNRYHLARYVPDLYWATVFGPRYVSLFGRETLLSAPAATVRELTKDVIYLQLTPDLLDVALDFPAFDAVRRTVKAHLNHDAFFDPLLGVDHPYQAPDFGWEEPKTRPSAMFGT